MTSLKTTNSVWSRRQAAALLLAALFPAWPLPVCAQITPVTVADTEAGIVNITNANNALQTAIQALAANPSAANAAAVEMAQKNYNDAVSAAATTTVTNFITSPSTVVSPLTVASGFASPIFAEAPGGTLTFSGTPTPNGFVINTGMFYLGTSAVAPAKPFAFDSIPGNTIDNTGTATIIDSSFSNNFGVAITNNVASSTVTIINSSFTGNMATFIGAAIVNDGTASIIGSSFTGNKAGFGGAITNDGPMTLIDSSFTDNTAHNSQGTALGGAIANSSGRGVVGDINLVVSPGHTSTFSGNTEDSPTGPQASSIFFDVGAGGLKVNVAAGGLLDMRDPMSGAPSSVSEMGQGVWALGGANEFSISPTPPGGSRPTTFSVNSGTLYLYAAGEVPDGTGQVAAGSIRLNSAGSSFTLGAGGTLVAAGANSISVDGDILLADGATIRGGTAADGSLVHVPLSGGITSRLDLSATEGVGLEGQVTVQAVAPNDTFRLAADLADAPGSPGGILVPGAGTLILTNNNTYSGDATIEGGTLVVGVPAPAQETSFALGEGNVFLNGGTLRTTSFQTGVPLIIHVGHNYTQGSGGTLALGIGGLQGEQYDRVVAGGNANLSGNLVVTSLKNFHPSAGNAFGILRNTGTRSGNFSLLDDSKAAPPFNITPSIITGQLLPIAVEVVAPNGVDLVYVKRPPTIPPPTGPEPPIIDDVPDVTLPPVNPEAPIPEEEIVQLLDPTAAQLTSLYQVSFTGAWLQRSNLDDRMFQLQQTYVPTPPPPVPPPTTKEAEGKAIAPPPPPTPSTPRWGVWASGYGNWSHIGTNLGYHFDTAGMSAGVDYLLTPHWAVGLFGGYSHNWINFKSLSSHRDSKRLL